jgi:hypothetical protein
VFNYQYDVMQVENSLPRIPQPVRNDFGSKSNFVFFKRISVALFVGFLTAFTISSCSTPAQRQDKLERFAQGVVKHLFDRNPKTYRQSIALLMREELDDNTIDKLQSAGKLPEPGLEEMKVVSDAEAKNTTNTVYTTSTKLVGDVKNATVPIQVVGRIVNYQNGKKKDEQHFLLEVDCKLTDEMEGYPRVVAIRGLENMTATSARPVDGKGASSHGSHKRLTRKSSPNRVSSAS